MNGIDWKHIKVERHRRKPSTLEESLDRAITVMALTVITGLSSYGFFSLGHHMGWW